MKHHFLEEAACAKLRAAGVDGSRLCEIDGTDLKTMIDLDYGQRKRFVEVRDRICRRLMDNEAARRKKQEEAAAKAHQEL